jgi:transketolase
MKNGQLGTMRDVFIEGLFDEMHKNENIFFLSADLGAPSLDKIREKFKERFINVGIAEQNLINVSTGLALEGYIVYAYAIASFLTMRAYEQIRVNLSITSQIRPINVNLIGVGAGLSYNMSGPTHHCLEDLSLMSLLPNFTVFSPSDWKLAECFLDYSINTRTPKYLRFDSKPVDQIYSSTDDLNIEDGFYEIIKGEQVCLVSTGYMTHRALKASREISHNIRNIRFDDELFVLNPERVEQLCDAIIESGFDLNIWVYARVNTIKESLLGKMARAGISWICLGIESGSERVRKDVQKSVKGDIKDVVRTIQNNGINILGNFMFGLPEDNMETMQQTLDLAIELNCEFVNFYSVMAYPGSRLFETTDKKVLPETWNEFSQHSYEAKPLPTKYLTSKEVLQFRDDAFDKYFSNEKYLDMVKKKFGNKVHDYIVNMNKIKLKRSLLYN